MRHDAKAIIRIAVLGMGLSTVTTATFAAVKYSNGFEKNTQGWLDGVNDGTPGGAWGTITRVGSGYQNGGGYADGIASAEGSRHARLGLLPREHEPTQGPLTNWGNSKPDTNFPRYGVFTRLDIYLDAEWASSHVDTRFDWSADLYDSQSDARHREFVFNVGTDALGFVISASGFHGRDASDPANPDNQPVYVTRSGWYTFEHRFYHEYNGRIFLEMRIVDEYGIWVASWTFEPAARLPFAGNVIRGELKTNEFPDLAIDAAARGSRNECIADGKADCQRLSDSRARKDCESEAAIVCKVSFPEAGSD